MKSKGIAIVAFGFLGATVALSQVPRQPLLARPGAAVVQAAAQAPARRTGPGVQAGQDAREPEVLAQCKNSHPPQNGGRGFGARGPQPPTPSADDTTSEIPGVIAAGQHWKTIWTDDGNNADGIVATPDGGILIAQNDKSDVVKLDKDGHASIAYTDTNTGGSLSVNKKGELFIVERALNPAVWELSPRKKLLANRYKGDPLDCVGPVLNDLSADSKGGVYFNMGPVFYANSKGEIMAVGSPDLRTNGIILSPDEKTLYVTNMGTLVALDVQPDGSLANQRTLGAITPKPPATNGGGDGSTVDAQGRVYVTGSGGVHVFSPAPEGKELGVIPTPRNVISVTFSGPGKKTLYAVAAWQEDVRKVAIIAIPMIAQGYQGRAK